MVGDVQGTAQSKRNFSGPGLGRLTILRVRLEVIVDSTIQADPLADPSDSPYEESRTWYVLSQFVGSLAALTHRNLGFVARPIQQQEANCKWSATDADLAVQPR